MPHVLVPENLQPWEGIDEVFPVFTSFLFHRCAIGALVILWWINVIKAIGCLRSVLMHCFGRGTCRANKYVPFLPALVENEWFVLLMKGAHISRSWLLISRLLSASGFRDGIHHVSVHQQTCWGDQTDPCGAGRGGQHGPQGAPEKPCSLPGLLTTSSSRYCAGRLSFLLYFRTQPLWDSLMLMENSLHMSVE